jgi:hypothetical protein
MLSIALHCCSGFNSLGRSATAGGAGDSNGPGGWEEQALDSTAVARINST